MIDENWAVSLERAQEFFLTLHNRMEIFIINPAVFP